MFVWPCAKDAAAATLQQVGDRQNLRSGIAGFGGFLPPFDRSRAAVGLPN